MRPEFTSRVNRHLMHGHSWSPSYFAASCGGAPLSIIRQYIEQQKVPVSPTSGLNPALNDGACARHFRSAVEAQLT
jgi:hypothetical protein